MGQLRPKTLTELNINAGRLNDLYDLTENRDLGSMRFALFIGCTVAYKLPHIEAATRYIMDALDIYPVDLPFSCCPEPNGVHAYSSELWYTLAARNLALARQKVKAYTENKQIAKFIYVPKRLINLVVK